jgi:hypothetical protein
MLMVASFSPVFLFQHELPFFVPFLLSPTWISFLAQFLFLPITPSTAFHSLFLSSSIIFLVFSPVPKCASFLVAALSTRLTQELTPV